LKEPQYKKDLSPWVNVNVHVNVNVNVNVNGNVHVTRNTNLGEKLINLLSTKKSFKITC